MSDDPKPAERGLSYREAGVDIDAGAALVERIKPLARSTARPGMAGELGGFGGLFDLKAAGYTDPVLVAANDGVGTKLKIAIESGIHETVGIDLVAMCVNDLIVQGAEPLFFLDYFATGALDLDVAEAVIGGIAEGCIAAGAALIGGETAEMPGLYAEDDYDLAGFAVGAMERGKALPRTDLTAGDKVLALTSTGPHSNGYSLIRRIVGDAGLEWDDPAPFAPGESLAHALLMPTRIYVRAVRAALAATDGLKALAHITGGGFVENIPRVLPETLSASIDLGRIEPHPVFSWLAQQGPLAESEMLKTFNCGIGMIAVVAPAAASTVTKAFIKAGETVVELGEIESREAGPAVRFSGSLRF